MRGVLLTGLVLCLAGIGAAQAESGGFFKNLLGGGGGGGAEEAPSARAPKLYDPNNVYCPPVSVREGAAAVQSYAGAAGDGSRLRDQITFARLSRECGPRPDGALSIKVGVELRALLGPAGSAGSFEAPLTISLKAGDRVLDTRTRRVRVAVASGSAQGTAAVIEDGLIVPAAQAEDYDIEVALGSAPARKPSRVALKRGGKPATSEASAEAPAPVAGQ